MSDRIGRYVLEERVARGGMAEVWRVHADDGAVLCIKRLDPGVRNDIDFIEMFRDEASLCLDFDHENIARMSELIDDGEELAMVMELVDGPSLAKARSAVEKQGGFGIDEALQITIQLCRALHHAHTRTRHGEPLRIVHRDVSPQNVLLSKDGKVKLVDFGIAKAAQRLTRTRTGALKGKCSYMAPEQVRGEPLDHRADQFATAILLWEMLTGRRLFGGRNEVLILEQVARSDPVPPSTVKPTVPKPVDRVVLRALGWAAEERYADMADFEKALQGCLDAMVQEDMPAGRVARNSEIDLVPLVERSMRALASMGSVEGGAQRTRVMANASTEEGRAVAGTATDVRVISSDSSDAGERVHTASGSGTVPGFDLTGEDSAVTDPLALPDRTGQFFRKRKSGRGVVLAALGVSATVVLAFVAAAVWLAEREPEKPAPVVEARPLIATLAEAQDAQKRFAEMAGACSKPCVAEVKDAAITGMWQAARLDQCLLACEVVGAGRLPVPLEPLEASLRVLDGHPCRTELLDDLLDANQLSTLGRAALYDTAQGCIWDVKQAPALRAKAKLESPAWPKKKKRTDPAVRRAHVNEVAKRGALALSLGEYEAAKALLVEAVDLEPQRVELHQKLGLAFRGLGDAVGAAHHYRLYFHAFPTDRERERLTLYMKRYKQRIDLEASANPGADERHARAHRLVVDAKARGGKDAVPLLEEARGLVPGDAGVLEQLGELYAAAGRQADARAAFDEAYRHRPTKKLRERIKQLAGGA